MEMNNQPEIGNRITTEPAPSKINVGKMKGYFREVLWGLESGIFSIGGESPELTNIGYPGYLQFLFDLY